MPTALTATQRGDISVAIDAQLRAAFAGDDGVVVMTAGRARQF